MNIYTNSFRLAIKYGSNEFIISLFQDSPVFDENASVIGSTTESVGSFIMTPDFAKNLAAKINELLSENDNAASE